MQGNQKPAISDDDFARYLTPSGRLDLDRLLNERWRVERPRSTEPEPQYPHSLSGRDSHG
jgi:hypothetical protein